MKLSLVSLAVVGGLFLLNRHLNSAVGLPDTKAVTANLAHYMMGIFYERQNKFDEAIEEYKQAISIDRESAYLHLRLGTAYIRKADFDKAVAELKQAKHFDPDSLEAGLMLALIYTSQGKSDEAASEYEDTLKKASSKDPQNINILKSLAEVYYQRRNFDAAIRTNLLILEINKEDYEALCSLGLLFEETGRRPEAIQKYKQALVLKPDYPDALNSLGYIYAEGGRNLTEAEALIRKALAKDPNNAAYVDSLGWVYFKKNLLDNAQAELEKASSLFADPTIFDHLGDVYFKKGLRDKAVESWKKSLELDPGQDKVKEKIDKLKR